jgi:hypothetical protein
MDQATHGLSASERDALVTLLKKLGLGAQALLQADSTP